MVNKNELLVLKKYESQGWKVIRGGAPDFLMLKVNGGKIEDFIFVEVKNPNSELTYEQAIYREVLEKRLGAKYSVELIQANHSKPDQSRSYHSTPYQTNPGQTIPNQAKCRLKFSLKFPDEFKSVVMKMLCGLEHIACLNKRRGIIKILNLKDL